MTDLFPLGFEMTRELACGVLAAVLSVLAYAPYVRDTLRGVTHPHRACWFIWSILATVSFFALLHEGASLSLFFVGAQAFCTSVVFVLSLSHGQGRWVTRTDGLVLCVAALGLVAWSLTDSAVYALAISIAISLSGGSLTVLKAYQTPESETLITWVMSWLAACAAMFSIKSWDIVLAAYPLYLFTLNGAIVLAVLLARRSRPKADVIHLTVVRDARWPQAAQVPAKGLTPLAKAPFPPQRRSKRRFTKAA